MKERKNLSRLKNDKNLRIVVKTLDKIIEEISTDNMNLTTNSKPRGKLPAWQQRLQKHIDQLRGDISIITE